MKHAPDCVSIVIPNWNGLWLLRKNLPSVIQAFRNSRNFIQEIIVVDDFSTDSSVAFLQKEYGREITLIRHKKNRGFASSVNRGVRLAKSSLVCLLNTDVLPSRSFLIEIFKDFYDPKVFGVSLHEKGYGPAIGKFENGYIGHEAGEESIHVKPTFWISGGSGVFRKSIWKELKGLDEELFNPFYWEDVDLGYRALKRGYKLLWEPESHVLHKHESVINTSSFRKSYITFIKERNHLLFNWKNLTSSSLLEKHRTAVIKRSREHPGYLKVVLAAGMRLPTITKRRRREREEARMSDEVIFEQFRK